VALEGREPGGNGGGRQGMGREEKGFGAPYLYTTRKIPFSPLLLFSPQLFFSLSIYCSIWALGFNLRHRHRGPSAGSSGLTDLSTGHISFLSNISVVDKNVFL
jgi:hypothetical protein